MVKQSIEEKAVDYRALIDDETWAWIDRYSVHYPENSIRLPMTEQRRLYDSMTASLCPVNLPEVAWRDTTLGSDVSVPVRHYGNGAAAAVILFCHGGGFALGSVETHHPICLDIVAQTGLDLVSVDYRLAPENIHPAQYEDVSSVFDWLCQHDPRPIILMGDSAGGTLAACLAHTKRPQVERMLGQILIYPGLGAPTTSPSYITHAHAPLLTATDVDYWRAIRHDRVDSRRDRRLVSFRDIELRLCCQGVHYLGLDHF